MTMTMGNGRARRNAKAPHYESHGLPEYDSVREARIALQNGGIRDAALDNIDQAERAEQMGRNEASPEDAAIAFGLKLPGEQDWQIQAQAPSGRSDPASAHLEIHITGGARHRPRTYTALSFHNGNNTMVAELVRKANLNLPTWQNPQNAEEQSQIKRGLAVLKMRGSDQDKSMREFAITEDGIRIGQPFNYSGENVLGFTGGG